MKRTVIALVSFAIFCTAGVSRITQPIPTETNQPTEPPKLVQTELPPPVKAADEYENAGKIEPVETEPTALPPSESAEWVPPAEEKKAEVSYRPVRESAATAEYATSPVETAPLAEPPAEQSTIPAETAPPATQPSTEQRQVHTPLEQPPEETQPQGCNHNWQTVAYEAQGHTELVNTCACGYTFESISQYDAHLNDYAGTAEMITVHGHWSTFEIFVVDSPAWSETVCTLCGAKS